MSVDLGLGASPRREFLYVSTDHNPSVGWHFWDHHRNEAVLTPHKGVAGRVWAIYTEEKTFQRKTKTKIRVMVDCGREQYAVQSSLDTTWSQGVLAALASLTEAQIRGAVILTVRPGDVEKVVLGDVYLPSGQKVFPPDHLRDAAPETLLARVRDLIGQKDDEAPAGEDLPDDAPPPSDVIDYVAAIAHVAARVTKMSVPRLKEAREKAKGWPDEHRAEMDAILDEEARRRKAESS